MSQTINVLMVCLGNICRSPTAQGVFETMVDNNALAHQIHVDSAGTSSWHINEPPDRRSQSAALKRGYDLSHQRGRQVTVRDFERYDYILAMDEDNLTDLKRLCPKDYKGHLGLFLAFNQQAEYEEVPDPYHGGGQGFELVLDLIEGASEGLLAHIQRTYR